MVIVSIISLLLKLAFWWICSVFSSLLLHFLYPLGSTVIVTAKYLYVAMDKLSVQKALLCACVSMWHLFVLGWVAQCVSAPRCSCSRLLLLWSLSWEALLAARSSCSFFHPNYIPIIKMLIQSVKWAIKRVIKKALFHQSTCLNSPTISGSLLIFTLSIMPKA